MRINSLTSKSFSYSIVFGLFTVMIIGVFLLNLPSLATLLLVLTILGISIAYGHGIQVLVMTTAKRKFIKADYNPDHLFNDLSKKIGKEKKRAAIFNHIQTVIEDHLHFEDITTLYTDKPSEKETLHYSYFQNHGDIVRLQELTPLLQESLSTYNFSMASILIPFQSLEGLEGLLVLDNRSGGVVVEKEDLAFLKTIQIFVNAVLHMTLPYEKLEEIVKTRLEVQGILKTVVTLSHEINSPLASLTMGLDVLQAKKEGVVSDETVLENMKIAVGKITDVMQRMKKIKTPQDADYFSGVQMFEVPKD